MSSVTKKMMMGADTGPSVKTIVNSIVFSPSGKEALGKQFGSACDNRRIWTASIWYRQGADNSAVLLGTTSNRAAGGNSHDIFYTYLNKLYYQSYDYSGGGTKINLITAANTTLFGANTGWHHFHAFMDTTQSTSTDRVKIYIDGTQLSFATNTYPAQNFQGFFMPTEPPGFTTAERALTSYVGTSNYAITQNNCWDGKLADVNVVDGIALPVDTFAADIDGTWTPMEYTGSYGSNGFNLNMANGAFGTDSSGNGNNFTSYQIASGDVSTDVPPA